MFRFDEEKEKKLVDGIIEDVKKIEKAVDTCWEKGVENVFLLGIGGTIASAQEIEAYFRGHLSLPVMAVNAADLTDLGDTRLKEHSLAVITSVTGNTPELLKAIRYFQKKGGRVIGFVEDEGTEMAETVDYEISVKGSSYIKLLLAMTRLAWNAGEFDEYDRFVKQLACLGDNYVRIQKEADEKARRFAEKHWNDDLLYVTGSGSLWGAAYTLAMCYMEEMLWMKTKSISCADFFHGTLEVIEKDSNLLVLMGEDGTRSQAERVVRFANQICDHVEVFDTADYALKGIEEKYRILLIPVIMTAVYGRIVSNLENVRKHPTEIRRYYHRLSY